MRLAERRSGGAVRNQRLRAVWRSGSLFLAALLALAVGPTAACTDVAAQPCVSNLAQGELTEQLDCLRMLAGGGTISSADLALVLDRLASSDAATDHRIVAASLDVVRAADPAALATVTTHAETPPAEVLSALLPYDSPLYRDRDKTLVVRLRAYLLVTLAEIGWPQSAYPALIDILGHIDETMPVLELVAATHVVRSLGEDGRPFIPYLLEAFAVRSGAHEVSLKRYEPEYPREEATTVQLEAVRSLGRVAQAGDREVAESLGEIVRNASGAQDPRVVMEAREALETIQSRRQGGEYGTVLALRADSTSQPSRLVNLDIAYTDHDGRTGVLSDLVDRPTLLTFFYTRCQNGKKCPMTIARLAALQRQLEKVGLTDQVRLLAITYEPHLDTPDRLKRHTSARGLALGNGARALRLDAEQQKELLAEMGIEVSYNAGWVNAHSVQLTLVGSDGEMLMAYRDLAWQTETVLAGLERLENGP